MQNPKEDKVSELENIPDSIIKLHDNSKLMRLASLVGTDSKTPELKLARYVDELIQSEVRQAEKIANGLRVKGIEEYRKFKGSDDEIERTIAWINQLSPWNLQRAVDHLKDRFKLQPPNTENKE